MPLHSRGPSGHYAFDIQNYGYSQHFRLKQSLLCGYVRILRVNRKNNFNSASVHVQRNWLLRAKVEQLIFWLVIICVLGLLLAEPLASKLVYLNFKMYHGKLNNINNNMWNSCWAEAWHLHPIFRELTPNTSDIPKCLYLYLSSV